MDVLEKNRGRNDIDVDTTPHIIPEEMTDPERTDPEERIDAKTDPEERIDLLERGETKIMRNPETTRWSRRVPQTSSRIVS